MSTVVGRFAPSPSGPLHFGSVVAAVASYLSARSQGGRWLLRIDDLDPPREAPGAAERIIRMLRALALVWDNEVVYQSRRGEAYSRALSLLEQRGLSFPCACTRAMVGRGPYPGNCRKGLPVGRAGRSVRLRVDEAVVRFDDVWLGSRQVRLAEHCGDFIIRRADGLVAYHLAVVVDDADSGVTEVVRGADLAMSTPQQIYLQSCLGLPQPRYAHFPVVLGEHGRKLSKQTQARAVEADEAAAALHHALIFLELNPPERFSRMAPRVQLDWALEHWTQREGVSGDRRYVF